MSMNRIKLILDTSTCKRKTEARAQAHKREHIDRNKNYKQQKREAAAEEEKTDSQRWTPKTHFRGKQTISAHALTNFIGLVIHFPFFH